MLTLPENLKSELKRLGEDIGRFVRGELDAVAMKSRRVPYGVYEERKSGAYMVRVRCPGGFITPVQLAAVADAALRSGSNRLHVTTRAEIQIHSASLDRIVPIQEELLPFGLSGRGGGGNTVRNITASELSGIEPGEAFDVTPHARALTQFFLPDARSWALPRKFKVAFSNTEADSAFAAWNDLGFVARVREGKRGFAVWAAGGMGGKPSVGIPVAEFIGEEEIFAYALALRDLFHDHGNRKNRHAARLRFVLAKLGRAAFLELFGEYLYRASESLKGTALPDFPGQGNVSAPSTPPENGMFGYSEWIDRHVFAQKQSGFYSVRLTLPLGDITPDDAKRLAAYLAPFGDDTLRFTRGQAIRLRNLPGNALQELYEFLQHDLPFANGGRYAARVLTCTGAATCKLGICNSRAAGRAVTEALFIAGLADINGEASIHVSGCPNSCAQHLLADLGFSGIASRKGERLYPAYSVAAGAVTSGPELCFGKKIGEVAARDLPGFIADVSRLWSVGREGGESLGKWLRGPGSAETTALLAGKYSRVPDFNEDRSYYYDWDGEEPFSLAGRSAGECSAGLFDFIERDQALVEKNRALWRDDQSGAAEKAEALRTLAMAAARMLLVTRGVEPKTPAEGFAEFRRLFLDTGLAGKDDASRRNAEAVLELGGREAPAPEYVPAAEAVLAFAEEVLALYRSMDDSLGFGSAAPKASAPPAVDAAEDFKDLRGVACPMNFVKTKIELSKLASGAILEILLDDGEPIKNVPGSVRGEGHTVLLQEQEGTHWKVRIRKG